MLVIETTQLWIHIIFNFETLTLLNVNLISGTSSVDISDGIETPLEFFVFFFLSCGMWRKLDLLSFWLWNVLLFVYYLVLEEWLWVLYAAFGLVNVGCDLVGVTGWGLTTLFGWNWLKVFGLFSFFPITGELAPMGFWIKLVFANLASKFFRSFWNWSSDRSSWRLAFWQKESQAPEKSKIWHYWLYKLWFW